MREFAASKPYIFRLLSIVGLVAFYIPDHSYRLCAGGFGKSNSIKFSVTHFSLLVSAVLFDQWGVNAVWLQATPERRYQQDIVLQNYSNCIRRRSVFGYVLGMIAHASLRMTVSCLYGC